MVKAIVFDFCGTITKRGQNTWRRTWELLGDEEHDDLLYEYHRTGEITETEWAWLICGRWKRLGVTADTFKEVAKNLELLNGVHETFEILHKKNIKIFILSGGMRQVIEMVFRREGVLKYITAIEAYAFKFDEDNVLIGMKMPKYDVEHKDIYIEALMKKHSLATSEVFFVGNDKNDEGAAKSGVATLCINPLETDIKNKNIWTYALSQCDDLRDILQFIN